MAAAENQSRLDFSPQALLNNLPQLPKGGRLWVGYSGGCDSHVLLHALSQLRSQLDIQLHAVYVNHGLSSHAEAWGLHCRQVCEALDVSYVGLKVDARHKPGQSPEAAARVARYQAIRQQMESGDFLCTAHHQDDQAETLLLQLLRGAGPKGLAAMAASSDLDGVIQLRPLLNFDRASLEAYACAQGLTWVDDHSNSDTRFDRNYLRHEILPRLQQRWPGMLKTLSRSAQLCGETAELVDELAAQDFAGLSGETEDMLSVAGGIQLDVLRQKNLLRHWIAINGKPIPSEAKIRHIISDVLGAAADKSPCVSWRGAEVRRFAGWLYLIQPLPDVEADQCLAWENLSQPLKLPDGVTLKCGVAERGLGLDRRLLKDVSVRFRSGGEICQPAGTAHHKSLKQLFQEWQVPPWERSRIPLIYVGEQLAAVVGYCVDESFSTTDLREGVKIVLV